MQLEMADEASPLKAPVVDEVAPRWCRKCKVVFTAPTCPEGHANFMYTKKIPADAAKRKEEPKAQPEPELEPEPEPKPEPGPEPKFPNARAPERPSV